MQQVKKGDTVYVISGKDKGKTGKVLKVMPKIGKIIVSGVNLLTKHLKPSPQNNNQGKVVKVPSPIYSSKAMLYSEKNGAPSRVGSKILKDGTKVRVLKKFEETV